MKWSTPAGEVSAARIAVLLVRCLSVAAAILLGMWLLLEADPPQINKVAALLTPVIAVLGAYIAFQQWRTANNKFRLDMFDRRFAVYKATITVVSIVAHRSVVTRQEAEAFEIAVRGAKFIFDDDVGAYLDKVQESASRLASLQAYIERHLADGVTPADATYAERSQHSRYLSEQWYGKLVDPAFKDYLRNDF